MRGALMVCGTASDVGKSRLVTGICRWLARRGLSVAPFKAQNMSLNSFVTEDGHEIARAQAVQAMAAGVEPRVEMNPILLKPTGPTTSQVVVMGRPRAHLPAGEYQRAKPELFGLVQEALSRLRAGFDVVVCEGAGSPAEINLAGSDLVNLRLAEAAGLPAILVGDIDRGGVFASLVGTLALLPSGQRQLVRGLVINKLRGDPGLLAGATEELARLTGVPTLGVVPWLEGLALDAEDSLSLGRLEAAASPWPPAADVLDVAVVRLPRISNFTDLDALAIEPSVALRLVSHPSLLGDPDLVVVPGTKATVADLGWLRDTGLDRALAEAATRPGGPVVLGICGGYQQLGWEIEDRIESGQGRCQGLGMLPVRTRFHPDKLTRRRFGRALGQAVCGYEIRHGRVEAPASSAWVELEDRYGAEPEGCLAGRVMGTSLHGLLEADGLRACLLEQVARGRGKRICAGRVSFPAARQAQIDRLADAVEAHLDLDALIEIIESEAARQ